MINKDAVSVLKTLLPKLIGVKPFSISISSSDGLNPPSGPITYTIVSLILIFDKVLFNNFLYSFVLHINFSLKLRVLSSLNL